MVEISGNNICAELEKVYDVKFIRKFKKEIRENILNFVKNRLVIHLGEIKKERALTDLDIVEEGMKFISKIGFFYSEYSHTGIDSLVSFEDKFFEENKDKILAAINPNYYQEKGLPDFLIKEDKLRKAYDFLIFNSLVDSCFKTHYKKIIEILEENLNVKIPKRFIPFLRNIITTYDKNNFLYLLANTYKNKGNSKLYKNSIRPLVKETMQVREIISFKEEIKIEMNKIDKHLDDSYISKYENFENLRDFYGDLDIEIEFLRFFYENFKI